MRNSVSSLKSLGLPTLLELTRWVVRWIAGTTRSTSSGKQPGGSNVESVNDDLEALEGENEKLGVVFVVERREDDGFV